jgi:NlpC/P60 family putative phage cell wall peptidase
MRGGRSDIVAAARAWIGTPYLHQGRRRGAGCDCLGLILGVWEDCIGALPELPPAYTSDWSEAAGAERLWAAAARHLAEKPAGDAAPGDVILFRMCERGVAKHLGVQTETGHGARFVHAYSGHGVVESRLTPPWARRIAARFSFPGGS